MSENNPIRVFVTHVFHESDDYLRVFEFLESVDRFYYFNVSKPENIPSGGGIDSIKEELIKQIKEAEAVIVLPILYEDRKDIVRFQMEVAKANNIKMVGMRLFGGIGEIPKEVADNCAEIVEWNDREMVDALRRQARGEDTQRWETIDFPGIEDLLKDD